MPGIIESPFSIQVLRDSVVTLFPLTENVPRFESPFSPGPIFFASLSAKWHIAHFLSNTSLPRAAEPAELSLDAFFGWRRCRRILRQNCSGYGQSCDPKNQIIPLHDAPSFIRSLSLSDEATLEPSYSLYLRLQFPLLLRRWLPLNRHKVQVPFRHVRDFRTFDRCKTVC